jgi:hypothetical protein
MLDAGCLFSVSSIRCWTLDVGRWAFAFFDSPAAQYRVRFESPAAPSPALRPLFSFKELSSKRLDSFTKLVHIERLRDKHVHAELVVGLDIVLSQMRR